MASTKDDDTPWFLRSSHPVLLPAHDALAVSRDEFDDFVRKQFALQREKEDEHDASVKNSSATEAAQPQTEATSESFTELTPSTSEDITEDLGAMDIDVPGSDDEGTNPAVATGNPFMKGLLTHGKGTKETKEVNMENKTFTDNMDLTNVSSLNPLVDLFADLQEGLAAGPRLRDLLNQAWAKDPLMTLKIIFNARSIHLGKASRACLYQCAGWLAQNHPHTLIANLRWLVRPVIEKKKATKKAGGDKDSDGDAFVVVEEPTVDENDPFRFDVKHGVSHGYWKDMLNILALAAHGKLDGLTVPSKVLNTENPGIFKGKSASRANKRKEHAGAHRAQAARESRQRRRGARVDESGKEDDASAKEKEKEVPKPTQAGPGSGHSKDVAKDLRRQTRSIRHVAVVQRLEHDIVYRCLHLAVARLFAEQLESDLAALNAGGQRARNDVSLCAKWAPSDDHFHDSHTFVISSIAEAMYPRDSFDDVLTATDDREIYIRHARERYRQDISKLRKHLDVVERKITDKNYGAIHYDRIPSIAMSKYSKIFIQNDLERFEKYIDKVAQGKANISGATLLPSTLIHAALSAPNTSPLTDEEKAGMSASELMKRKTALLEQSVLDGQWKTLVQRIKDSGTLTSTIAVCDVSGSMCGPIHPDKTRPLDSAIGLSLLVAEVTAEPFGGAFITFTSNPQVEKVDLSMTLPQKVQAMASANWGMSTNFTSVFQDIILPIAKEHNVKPEDMVKRIIVFSDMQFNHAESNATRGNDARGSWSTSYERVKLMYEEAGYELPELVFWNLAEHTSKPVTVTDEGTALVSGYSQGMLKVFLDGGGFEEEEEDEVVVTKKEDGTVVTETVKAKTDPLKTAKKAVSHKAYEMISVLD